MTPITPEGFESYVTDWQMSPGLASGGFLFLTGMTGAGPDGTVSPDAAVQIQCAFERAQQVLEHGGAGFSDVVEMTSYHVGIQSHIEVFRTLRSSFIRAPYPAWTAIEVAGFVTPGTLVELRLIARLPEQTP